tara:strand:- start:834 stop:2870 length:2037 start_codon:yes stop_codon:yes gene_type:complete
MSFLYPKMLWGLFAVLIPLLIHFFHSRNIVKVDFSSIFYLTELKNTSIKKLKTINWLLTLIRMAIIFTLILMFATPIVKNNSLWIPSKKEALALVFIDNSASMSLEIDGESLLEQSLKKVSKIVSTYSGSVELKVFQTNPQKMIFSKFVKNIDFSDLNEIKINQSYGQDNIWTYVNSILKNVKTESANKECFILSDFSSYPDTLFESGLDDWQFYFFENDKSDENISIKSVVSKNQIKLQNQDIDFVIKVENMGNDKINNVPIEITLDEKRMGQIAASFEEKEVKDFLFRILPPRPGILNGNVSIGSDIFKIDNNQTFEISIPEKFNCKIISNSKKNSKTYERILNSINGNTSFIEFDVYTLNRFSRIDLSDTDVLIVADAVNFTPRAIESLKRYLKAGGSIIWFSGENYGKLKAQTISNLSLPKLIETVDLKNKSFLNVKIEDRDNEIFQNLNMRDIRDYFPKIFKYNSLEINFKDKMILSMGKNIPFLLNLDSKLGSIYLFTSPLELSWNDFSLKGILIPVIYRMIAISSNDETNISPVKINEEKLIKIKNQDLNSNWILKTPSQEKILLVPDYKNQVLIIDQTNELGSYSVYSNDVLFTSFSTLLSPREYPSSYSYKRKINEKISNLNYKWIDKKSNIKETISSNRHGMSLWRFFLLFAIILYIIESFLSRPRKN